MRALIGIAALSLASWTGATPPRPAPEFTHTSTADWVNSEPLTLAGLKGKAVLLEFWAFECVNCLNSKAWVEAMARDKASAGLVVVGVHTPERPNEKPRDNVRRAVARLGIHHPVMIDGDYSYWNTLHNRYWPTFYFIGRDGQLYGSVIGEVRVGDDRAKKMEQVIDRLLSEGVE